MHCCVLLMLAGRVIASTVAENEVIMKELFGATPCRFKPSIPHLVSAVGTLLRIFMPRDISYRAANACSQEHIDRVAFMFMR